jgi:hypothetical protein
MTNDDTMFASCSGSERDRRNQRRILLWVLLWGASFITVSLGIKRAWWPLGVTVAGVAVITLLGLASIFMYRRFLQETDELRRKIEVEALALAFGVGVIGGLSYWLLAVSGAVPASDLIYVFVAMILLHPLGVWIGQRRYS